MVNTSIEKGSVVFQALILALIGVLAFSTRVFSIVKHEVIIHEFDPYFNFRATVKLVEEGFHAFNNWFDELTWFPYGRLIGGTLYPGLMLTAALFHYVMNALNLTINITQACVYLSPTMGALTSFACFLLTKEVWNPNAGLLSAAFIAIVPGFTSRSVAGSFDNECCAIFALIFSFYTWVKAVKTGSIAWGTFSALAYFYMVATWGGYIFIINIIPVHVIVLLLSGRYSSRLYIAYSSFYIIGTLTSFLIPMVSFIPVSSPEHGAAFGAFALVQLFQLYTMLCEYLPEQHIKTLLRHFFLVLLPSLFAVFAILMLLGYFPRLTGRLLSLLGSTSNIAIIKSVSEHQPTPWGSFFFDLNIVVLAVPAGLYFCFSRLTDANLFIILYVLFISYFSGIMIRLILVFTPAACVLAGIAVSETLLSLASGTSFAERYPEKSSKSSSDESSSKKKAAAASSSEEDTESFITSLLNPVSLGYLFFFSTLFYFFVTHCTWVTSLAYSSPSVVLSARQHDGSNMIFDDFREAYYWLRKNTDPDAKVMSWWDYGYQITAMGNRTTIVDNNTRNNTHIATVGYAMSSPEERAYPVLRRLDVDYVLVVFGGMVGYASDDINKFLWMIRIGGGVFPEVVEEDYYNSRSEFRVDSEGSPTLLNSLMYKMCYYRFGDFQTEYGQGQGFDRVRRAVIGNKDITFKHLEEAYTTEHWMVRIYRVIKDRDLPEAVSSTSSTANARKLARSGTSPAAKTRKQRADKKKLLQQRRRARASKLVAAKKSRV